MGGLADYFSKLACFLSASALNGSRACTFGMTDSSDMVFVPL